MKEYTVVIAGGGPAGLSAALTLGAAEQKQEPVKGKTFHVVDAGNSDLLKAELNYVPGIPAGTPGPQALGDLRQQALAFPSVSFREDKVVEITGGLGNFTILLESGEKISAHIVILATGFHSFEVDGTNVHVAENTKAPRPGKIAIQTDLEGRVREGLYAAGIISAGVSSMYASAAGSGVQIACNILEAWSGKPTIVHDVMK